MSTSCLVFNSNTVPFPQTYGDISWHRRLRRCTLLWGCVLTGKMWGCTQTAEGTGSHTLRCHWNWCKPAESTRVQLADGTGDDFLEGVWNHGGDERVGAEFPGISHRDWESITAAFHFYMGLRHVNQAAAHCLWMPNGRKIEAIDPQPWCKRCNVFL